MLRNVFFMVMTVIEEVIKWPESIPPYSGLGKIGSGHKLKGKCLINKSEYRNRLSRLYMPKEDLNK